MKPEVTVRVESQDEDTVRIGVRVFPVAERVSVPWWSFWNPFSGWRGGLIAGAIVSLVCEILNKQFPV